MSFSLDLRTIVTKFESIDPSVHSINDSCDPIAKRSQWQNFWGWVISLLTFGLCANNGDLDRTTRSIVDVANKHFEMGEWNSPKDLKKMQRTFSKLESIVSANGGSERSKVHLLADRVQALIGPSLNDMMCALEIPKELGEDFVPSDELKASIETIERKVTASLIWEDYAEVKDTLAHFQSDPVKFELVVSMVLDYCKKYPDSRELIFADVSWPSDELKKRLLG